MAMFVDPLLSQSVSDLYKIILYVAKETANFKPELKQLIRTLERITPNIVAITNLNQKLDRPKQQSDMFIEEIKDADKLVRKCQKIKWNLIKKFTHSLKLKDVNNKLLRFFQIDVQADQSREIKETLVAVDVVQQTMHSLSLDVKVMQQTLSSGRLSVSSSNGRSGYETIARGKLGWRVPVLPRGIVAFDEPLTKLKARVLDDIDDVSYMDCDEGFDNGSVVVVSAAGGCGKTTLVTMLCHDLEIKAKFGENIFFVTVSETPNFMVIANDLRNPNSFSQQVPFQSDEDAKNKLENFLYENVSGPILLVLDDVWSELFIKNFAFEIRGYKVVVTSRFVFLNYDAFQFEPLSDDDAKTLFSISAFKQGKEKISYTIDNDIVNQMVRCCKKHPLTLSIVGSSLNRKDKSVWLSMLKTLSQGGQSVLDLNKDVLIRLEKSFEALDENIKQCYLDFGLFPEDQRIPASALLNMWIHLYKHDEEGIDTLAKIFELSYRNLVNLMTTGKNAKAIVNYCEQQFVTQHDLLRELAICLSSKVPEAQRTRLIINARGEDLPESIMQVQEPMRAQILSISTEGSFLSRWCNMKVPNLEVLVLNLMSETYALPNFLEETPNLKIINITNYGLYPTEFKNSHFLTRLSNLTTIRLERVTISSLSESILPLVNLQKISLIMCIIGNAFATHTIDPTTVWPRLVEMEMDYCQDLVRFPVILCNSVHLKKLSITNCNELFELPEELGKLISLETLSLRSCTKLEKLPESITVLEKLSVVDISDCLSLSELPERIGMLCGLRTIYMKGCTGIHELPLSVDELLSHTQVVCNEEISIRWGEFPNVDIHVVEEDRMETLMKIM